MIFRFLLLYSIAFSTIVFAVIRDVYTYPGARGEGTKWLHPRPGEIEKCLLIIDVSTAVVLPEVLLHVTVKLRCVEAPVGERLLHWKVPFVVRCAETKITLYKRKYERGRGVAGEGGRYLSSNLLQGTWGKSSRDTLKQKRELKARTLQYANEHAQLVRFGQRLA